MQYEIRLLNHSHKTLWMRKVYKAKINQVMLSIRGWEILGLGRNSLLFAVSFCGFCSSHVLEQVPSDGLKFDLSLYGHFYWKTATQEMLHQKKMGGIGLKGGWEPKHAE